MELYQHALARLRERGLIYADARSRSQRQRGSAENEPLVAGPAAWRLDMARALTQVGGLAWTELDGVRVAAEPASHGDVVLARKDTPTSYHLAVTVDDAEQGVTHVIRGRDLFDATAVHRLLQELLGLAEPVYHHHPLILDERTGRRFAKSDGSVSLRVLREQGATPASIRSRLGV
jgi:glutamyl-Q tRNA(Asp) synthetase